VSIYFYRPTGFLFVLIVLGECATKTPIDCTEDSSVSQNLRPSGTVRGQNNKQTRRQQNKEKNGDDNVKIHI
jgi:hypothetical protein